MRGNHLHSTHFQSQTRLYGPPVDGQSLHRFFDTNSNNPNLEANFLYNEIQRIKDIDHQYVVPFTKISMKNEFYIKRHFVMGRPLSDIIFNHGPQTIQVTFQIVKKLLTAIEYLHQKDIVLQTLKLENIIMSRGEPKIVDFGISAILDDTLNDSSLLSLIMLGPEGMTDILKRSKELDIFHFGIVFYTLLKGSLPWKSKNLGLIISQLLNQNILMPPEIDPVYAAIIKDCLNPDPSERPTASQLLKKFDQMTFKIFIPKGIGVANSIPEHSFASSRPIVPTSSLKNIGSLMSKARVRTVSTNCGLKPLHARTISTPIVFQLDQITSTSSDGVIPQINQITSHQSASFLPTLRIHNEVL